MKVKRITALMLAVVMVVGVLCATTVTASAATVPAKITVRFVEASGRLYYAKTFSRLSSVSGGAIYRIETPKAPINTVNGSSAYYFHGWYWNGTSYKAGTTYTIAVSSSTTQITMTPRYSKSPKIS